MNQWFIQIKRICFSAMIVVLVSCAASSEVVKERRKEVNIKVIAENAGVSLNPATKVGKIAYTINDIDGLRLTWTWDETECDKKALDRVIRDCEYSFKFNRSHLFYRVALAKCIEDADLPNGQENNLPDATNYLVALATIAKPNHLDSGTPLFRSGGPVLGGVRMISSDSTNSVLIHQEVEMCVNESLKHGLIDSFGPTGEPPGGKAGIYISQKSQSVRGFLKRFDKCMEKSGYVVEPLSKGK